MGEGPATRPAGRSGCAIVRPSGCRRCAALVLSVLAIGVVCHGTAQDRSIDDFFRTFTDDWVRMNPNQATSVRYFSGPEQDALESQLTPQTREWRQRRVALALPCAARVRPDVPGALVCHAELSVGARAQLEPAG